MSDDLQRWRNEFPTLSTHTHLISHSLGPVPARVAGDLQRFFERWRDDSISAWWEHWLPEMDQLAATISRVLGVAPGSVTLDQNVSTIVSRVASCFSYAGERRRIVYTDLSFSTCDYVWREQQRYGAEVVVVPTDGIGPATDALLDTIDERTLIVPISHVLFLSGAMQDVAAVVEKAHSVGAFVFLDTYQSAGAVPLQLEQWGVDLACGGSVKWACGGPGCSYLYVHPAVRDELRPAATGWFAHEQPFAFAQGPIRHARDATRFASGTPPVASFVAARAGWDIVAEVGPSRIRERSLELTTRLMDALAARGIEVRTPRDARRRGGTVCFDLPAAESVSRALLERGFLHDHRPRCGLRVGPHFFNTAGEVDAFVEALDEVRR